MAWRTLIVDDECPARRELRFLLEKFPEVEVVGEATSVPEAKKLLEAIDYALLFLDIQLPGISGLELVEFLHKTPRPPQVVLVTAHGDYALQAFEFNVADYLLKPVSEKRLGETLARVARRLASNSAVQEGNKKATAPGNGQDGSPACIPVEKQGKTLLLTQEDVAYAFSQNNNVYLRTFQDTYLTSYSLKELENRLDPQTFFRAHRCYLVNLTRIQEIIPYFNGTFTLVVNDNKRSELPVSRNQARRLRRLLGL